MKISLVPALLIKLYFRANYSLLTGLSSAVRVPYDEFLHQDFFSTTFNTVRCNFYFRSISGSSLSFTFIKTNNNNNHRFYIVPFQLFQLLKALHNQALIHEYFVDIFLHRKLLHESAKRTNVTIYHGQKCQQNARESMLLL